MRLAELEDEVQRKCRELVTTKTQLESVEADRAELMQRIDSLNTHKNNVEQLLRQRDRRAAVSSYVDMICYDTNSSLI